MPSYLSLWIPGSIIYLHWWNGEIVTEESGSVPSPNVFGQGEMKWVSHRARDVWSYSLHQYPGTAGLCQPDHINCNHLAAWPWRLGGEERKQRQPVFLHPLLLLLHTPVGLESHLSSTWFLFFWASLVAQRVKNPPEKQETQVLFLDQEDSQKKEMGTHSSILVWKIQWTEEPGGL